MLRALIGAYKEAFKVPTLSDALLFANYAQTILVVDEVCKEVRDAPAYCACWAVGAARREGADPRSARWK